MSLFVCLISLFAVGTVMAKMIQVQGHRGARARFPENTIPAFDYAVGIGADGLELDIAITKDNIPVISHDPEINRDHCRDENGRRPAGKFLIHSLTLNEVKKFDCGSVQNEEFPEQRTVPGTRIPTLDELFTWFEKSTWARAKMVEFNIETKSFPKHPDYSPPPYEFAALILTVVKAHNLVSRSMIESFDYRTLAAAKKIEPSIRISALTSWWETGTNYARILDTVKPEILSPKSNEISESDIELAHRSGAQVFPWTVNDEREWARLIAAGTDGIITDDPEALIHYLKRNKLR